MCHLWVKNLTRPTHMEGKLAVGIAGMHCHPYLDGWVDW
jgi:hypothetical protein